MMEGMRYERGGKGKYWIPKPGEINSRTPLLSAGPGPSRASTMSSSKGGRGLHDDSVFDETDEAKLDAEDERLFTTAKALEFGDWNVRIYMHGQLGIAKAEAVPCHYCSCTSCRKVARC